MLKILSYFWIYKYCFNSNNIIVKVIIHYYFNSKYEGDLIVIFIDLNIVLFFI